MERLRIASSLGPLSGIERQANTVKDRWTKALEALSEKDKLLLQLDSQRKDYLGILDEVLDIAVEKRKLCIP